MDIEYTQRGGGRYARLGPGSLILTVSARPASLRETLVYTTAAVLSVPIGGGMGGGRVGPVNRKGVRGGAVGVAVVVIAHGEMVVVGGRRDGSLRKGGMRRVRTGGAQLLVVEPLQRMGAGIAEVSVAHT